MDQDKYGKGSFLIANPVLPDPNFSRTVVLLCNHDDQGSFGLVVNRRSELKATELFADTDFFPDYDREVYVGGPVSQSQVFYLCRSPEPIPGLEPICEGIHLGMSWETLAEAYQMLDHPNEDIRFYLGYSGWGSGQLDGEMEQKSWLICDAREQFVFESVEARIWPQSVKSLGKEYEYLLTAPVDPRRN